MKKQKENGKPIFIRPPRELREKLDLEKLRQNRSLNNLIVVILQKFFRENRAQDAE